jgi:NAD(P)H-hydrate epimerase
MTTLSRAQVREIDRRAIEEYGVPGIVLMENAGRGAAEVLMPLVSDEASVLIICGSGNNGGDGFVIARHLDLRGIPVKVWLAAHPDKLTPDAAMNYQIVVKSGIRCEVCELPAINGLLYDINAYQQDVMVDALFGTGLSGPLGDPYDRIVAEINDKNGGTVVAIDIPSGLHCDTGKPLGPCVRADHTVTFIAPKAGFTNPEAKEWLGEVHVVGIGAPRVLLEQYGL